MHYNTTCAKEKNQNKVNIIGISIVLFFLLFENNRIVECLEKQFVNIFYSFLSNTKEKS